MTSLARPVYLASFFLSGGCALVYQVVWSKQLQYFFGSTTEAVGTILSVFMAGLGLGAWYLGPRIDRAVAPLRLYARLEIGIGLYGIASLWLLRIATAAFAAAGELPAWSGTPLKLLLSAVVLLPPCLLMGATYPALLRGVSTSVAGARRDAGLFYAVNVLGALAGTCAAGFFALPALGLTRSAILAGVINLAIGGAVLAVSPRARARTDEADETGDSPEPAASSRLVDAALFWSGASIMALEVSLTRVLTLIFGVSSYAFTIVLAVFLLGLGLGALTYERALARRVRFAQFAWVQVGLAAAGVAALLWLPVTPRAVLYLRQIPGIGFGALLAGKTALAAVLLLPLALVAGLGLPVLIGALVGSVGRLGRTVGRAYLINTAGTIAGSLASGFLLVEWLGTQGTLRAVLFVTALLGAVVAWAFETAAARRACAVAGAAVLAATVGLAPAWPQRLFINSDTDGSHRIATRPIEVEDQLRSTPNRILFFSEGRNATVAVTETPTARSLLVNAHPDGSDTAADMATQVMLGVLPLTAHPDPRDVLVIGFGTGVSTRSAARLDTVERIDAIEIEPAVIEASPWFHHVNGAVERDPRVHVHLTDARTFAATTSRRYDVIVSEPSNPWRAGVANLYTEDFFRSIRRLLDGNGVLAQWMHLYFVRDSELRMVLATMSAVFPEIQVWWLDEGNVALLASERPLAWSAARATALLDGEFREDRVRFARAATVDELFGRLLLDADGVRAFAGSGTPLHRDDRPRLEYLAPRGLIEADGRNTLRLVAAKLRDGTLVAPAAGGPDDGAGWLAVASMFDALGLVDEEALAVRRALAAGRPLAAVRASTLALRAGDAATAQRLLSTALETGDRSADFARELAYAHAELAARLGDLETARAALEVSGDWDGEAGIMWLGYAVTGGLERDAFESAERLLAGARLGGRVGNPEVQRIYARLWELAGARENAERLLDLAERLPTDERLSPLVRLKLRALLLERLGRPDEALDACHAVADLGVLDLELLGVELRALRALGREAEARRVRERLRALDPEAAREPIPLPLGADPG